MKKMKVKDVLSLMDDDTPVSCQLYAYGIFYASSYDDGMRTAADCRDRMNYDCLNARATNITCAGATPMVVVYGELVS